MKKNSNYLSKFNKELNIISVRTGVNRKDVEEVLDHFFLCFRNWIKDRKMPTISIQYFGRFEAKKWRIDAYLRKYFYHYRLGRTPAYKIKTAIQKVWKVRERLKEEKLKIKTHRKWDKLKLDPLTLGLSSPPKTETDCAFCTEEKKSTDK